MFLSDELLEKIELRLNRYISRCGSLPVCREDLVGEVLLRLITMSREQEIRYPITYAKTILTNLIRDHLRKAERAQHALEVLAATCAENVPALDAAQEIADTDQLAHLLAKAHLTPIQEKVIRLVYLSGMKPVEVARELKKNPGTIQRHMDRALAKLECCAAALEQSI